MLKQCCTKTYRVQMSVSADESHEYSVYRFHQAQPSGLVDAGTRGGLGAALTPHVQLYAPGHVLYIGSILVLAEDVPLYYAVE